MLEVHNFIFYFTRANTKRFALNFRGDIGHGFWNSVGTVKTLGTLGEGLNAFCIIKMNL
jgi:hypothetical protein